MSDRSEDDGQQTRTIMWLQLISLTPDIKRIAERGVNGSERDRDIVKGVFLAMMAELGDKALEITTELAKREAK